MLERAMLSPEWAVFENSEALGSHIPYAVAGAVAPPLSYQYLFPFYSAPCPEMAHRNVDALRWVAMQPELEGITVLQYAGALERTPTGPRGCSLKLLAEGAFFAVTGPYEDNGWVHFTWTEIWRGIIGS